MQWEHKTDEDGDPDADAWIAGLHQSLTGAAPRMPPPVREQRTVSVLKNALGTVLPEFVCLAAVSRLADFFPDLGRLVHHRSVGSVGALSAVLSSRRTGSGPSHCELAQVPRSDS